MRKKLQECCSDARNTNMVYFGHSLEGIRCRCCNSVYFKEDFKPGIWEFAKAVLTEGNDENEVLA
jgi:hypothetical protein